MAEEVMLSTIDNPYNPFDNFDQWYMFDELKARQENRPTCCGYLARVDYSSDEVSEAEQIQTMNDIIDEILTLNLSGKFIKLTRSEAAKLA